MFKSLCFAAVLAAMLHTPGTGRADLTARSCQTTGPATAIVKGNACAGFTVGTTKVMFPYLGSGRLISSADGRTVAMVQSYLYGRIDRSRDVIEVIGFDGASNKKNPMALYIYRDGKLVASHRIHDVVQRRGLIWPSTSHIHWVRGAKISRAGQLHITTTGFRELVFDAQTGALTKSADASEWKTCTVIAGGTLDLSGQRLIKPFDYKRAKSTRAPLAFSWGNVARKKLTNKAHTVGCFVRKGKELLFERQLSFL